MRILIGSGSSGGHIFPAIALADELKNSKVEVLLVLPRKALKLKGWRACGPVEYIHGANLTFKINRSNIVGLGLLLWGGWESLLKVIKFKPDVAVGFGSLNTLALMFWAWLFRIKTIIHEQNVIPGKANRLLSKFVDKVAVSFKQTANFLKIPQGKIVLTGNPLRKSLVKIDKLKSLDFFGFQEGKFNILITGGSQGAHKLNSACLQALLNCPDRDRLQVIHISGEADFAQLKRDYAASNIRHQVFDFFPEMQYAYSLADLVICRAGATTIAELQKFGLAALLVPYPFAYAHQWHNAKVLEAAGAAEIIPEDGSLAESLQAKLEQLIRNGQKLAAMRQGYLAPKLDAACALAREVLNLN